MAAITLSVPTAYFAPATPGAPTPPPERGTAFLWEDIMLSLPSAGECLPETARPWCPGLPMLPVLPHPFSDKIGEGLGKAKRWKLRLLLHSMNPHCEYCGRHVSKWNATLDHVHAKSKGGTNALNNFRLVCGRCNCLKDNHSLDAFLAIINNMRRNVQKILAERNEGSAAA